MYVSITLISVPVSNSPSLLWAGVVPKHPAIKLWACLAKDVALDVFITEHPAGVDILQHANKVVKSGVHGTKDIRSEGVRFCPVRTPAVAEHDGLETFKQCLVGYL